jgi:hypothetical protein
MYPRRKKYLNSMKSLLKLQNGRAKEYTQRSYAHSDDYRSDLKLLIKYTVRLAGSLGVSVHGAGPGEPAHFKVTAGKLLSMHRGRRVGRICHKNKSVG